MQQVVSGDSAAYPNSDADSPADYLYGRNRIPPFLQTKRQRTFFFGEVISLGRVTNGVPSSNTITIKIDRDAYFLCEGINITYPSTPISQFNNLPGYLVDLQITDLTYGKSWSNDFVNKNDIAGNGFNTKWLPDPILIRPDTILQFTFRNRAISTQDRVHFTLIGRKIYDVSDAEYLFTQKKHWYQYVMPNVGTATTGTPLSGLLPAGNIQVIQKLQIFSEADFILKKIYSSDFDFLEANINADLTLNPPAITDALVNIRDTSIDQSFFSKQVSLRAISGNMMPLPFVGFTSFNALVTGIGNGFTLKRPIFIKRNSILEFRLSNPDPNYALAASTIVFQSYTPLRITLEGISVYS